MSDISNVTLVNPSIEHINALLSKLAYEDLSANFNFQELGENFSIAEKNYLASNYRALDAKNTSDSGFQGCLLEKLDSNENPTGEVVMGYSRHRWLWRLQQ